MRGSLHHREPWDAAWLMSALLAVILISVGCQRRTAMATPPVVIVPSTPESTSPKPVPPDITSTIASNAQPIALATAPPPAPPNKKHSRKKTSTAASTNDAPAAAAPGSAPSPAASPTASPSGPAPQISPQVTLAEQAAIKQRVKEQMGQAQENLRQAETRQLSATQHDMAEKARSFLAQADAAVKDSNWTLAVNLADKARVLSKDLLHSF